MVPMMFIVCSHIFLLEAAGHARFDMRAYTMCVNPNPQFQILLIRFDEHFLIPTIDYCLLIIFLLEATGEPLFGMVIENMYI